MLHFSQFEVSSNQAMLFSRIEYIIGIQTSKCPNTNGIISVTGSYKCGYAFLQIDPTVIAYIIMHSTKYVFNLFSVIAKCLNKWSVMLLPCQLTSSQKKLCYCTLKESWFNPNTFDRCICKVLDQILYDIL